MSNISSDSERVRLDLADASLWRGSLRMPLRAKTLQVLQTLIEHDGELVAKEALMDAVWPDVVVTDTVLGVCIREIRQALGDDARRPEWIETVYKRGYRCIARIEITQCSSHAHTGATPFTSRPTDSNQRPAAWRVPHPRNVCFSGREQALSRVYETLRKQNRQVVTGLGGIGKTQLVVEYAHRFASRYAAVLWISSDTPAALVAQFTELAHALDLVRADSTDYGVAAAALQRWLKQQTRWLVVFDNVEHPEVISAHLPDPSAGHVIITSRNPNWSGVGDVLTLGPLARADAAFFLQRRTEQDDSTTANVLAESLGDLPLALEQAGAYIDAAGITLSGYRDRFARFSAELLRRGQTSTGYTHSVATTWGLAFDKVKLDSKLAQPLLTLCAFFAADAISRKMLAIGLPRMLDVQVSSLAFDEAIIALRYHSLVDAGPNDIAVHRLVQKVTRQRLSETERHAAIKSAMQVVISTASKNDVSDAAVHTHLLPHATTVAAFALELPSTQSNHRLELELLSELSHLLIAMKGYGTAELETVNTRALALSDALNCARGRWQALRGLAAHYLMRAELERAEQCASECDSIARSLNDDSRVISSQNLLAQIVCHKGEVLRAQSHLAELLNALPKQTLTEFAGRHHGAAEAGVVCASYQACLHWLAGQAELAAAQAQTAVVRAQTLNHPFSHAFSLLYKAVIHQLRGETQATQHAAIKLAGEAEREDYAMWSALAQIMHGWTLTFGEQSEVGLSKMSAGLTLFRAIGGALTLPYLLGLLACAQGRSGKFQQALAHIDEALEQADSTAEHWYNAELYRHRGEILLQARGSECTQAIGCFEKAITIATKQNALMLVLNATVSLANWWCTQGEHAKARDLVQPVYARFSEGFSTDSLTRARATLRGGIL